MKKALVIAGVLIVLAFLGFQCLKSRSRPEGPVAQTAKVERGPVTVTVVESGAIEAVQHVEVKSRVSGRVQKLLVKEGDRVQKGQLLARIDPQELKLQLEQTSAQLRGAQSGVARSSQSAKLTADQVRNALTQAEARYFQSRREWEMQPALSRAAVEQARIVHENSQRMRDLLRNTTHAQERVQVAADLRQAEATYEADKRNFERTQSLLEKGYVSQRTLDESRARAASSEAALARAQEAQDRLAARQKSEAEGAEQSAREAQAVYDQAVGRAGLDSNKEQAFRDAKAAWEQAKANFRQIEIERASQGLAAADRDRVRSAVADHVRQLRETEIRAPMSGVVTKRLVEEGELVTALSSFTGGTPIVEIADLRGLQVKLDINEIDVAKLRVGMKSDVEIDAIPDRAFPGEVIQIAPASTAGEQAATSGQAAVVKFKVEVRLSASDPAIKPGMSAKCSTRVIDRKGVLRLPVEFVGKDADGRFIMVRPPVEKVKAPPKPQKRRVTTGASSATHIEILSGAREGEVVEKPAFTGPRRVGAMQVGGEE